jgi:hypothetical protein
VSEQQVLDVEATYGGVGIAQTLVVLTCGVLFLVWFSRVDGTVRTLGAAGLRHGHGWAVGSWFVPFLNLVRPKQMVDDVWRASDPQLPQGAGMLTTGRAPRWLMLWWALWLLTSALAWAGVSTGETLEDLRSSVVLTLLADLASVGGGVLALLLVRLLSRRVQQQAQSRGYGTA